MLPPNTIPLGQLSREEGISYATLAKWRAEARAKGRFLPDAHAAPEGWTSRDKLAAVIETASLNEHDLGEYCRQRGLYAEQIRVWREACERANDWDEAATHRIARETRDGFYPKESLQPYEVKDLQQTLDQALSFKFIPKAMKPDEVKGLIDILVPAPKG